MAFSRLEFYKISELIIEFAPSSKLTPIIIASVAWNPVVLGAPTLLISPWRPEFYFSITLSLWFSCRALIAPVGKPKIIRSRVHSLIVELEPKISATFPWAF